MYDNYKTKRSDLHITNFKIMHIQEMSINVIIFIIIRNQVLYFRSFIISEEYYTKDFRRKDITLTRNRVIRICIQNIYPGATYSGLLLGTMRCL